MCAPAHWAPPKSVVNTQINNSVRIIALILHSRNACSVSHHAIALSPAYCIVLRLMFLKDSDKIIADPYSKCST